MSLPTEAAFFLQQIDMLGLGDAKLDLLAHDGTTGDRTYLLRFNSSQGLRIRLLGLGGLHSNPGPSTQPDQLSKQAETLHPNSKWFPSVPNLRSLSEFITVDGRSEQPLLVTRAGEVVWALSTVEGDPLLIIGTQILDDLISFRQGLPSAISSPQRSKALFGFPNERAVYLFEATTDPHTPFSRQADWWHHVLGRAIAHSIRRETGDILQTERSPRRFLVVTGDDDQADLSTYEKQQAILGRIPVTYFLHPLSRHTKRTLLQLRRRSPESEIGIHPDALDHPTRYDELISDQLKWFRGLTGFAPASLRNHGFLNDGYWRHANSWVRHEIRASSNIPGLDGRILTNSLLPAPIVLDDQVLPHWSVVTAFGDGMVFAQGMSDNAAAERVAEFAQRMINDFIDGALVINLHPQNIASTPTLHHQVKDLVRSGFEAVTLSQLVDEFAFRSNRTRFTRMRGFLPGSRQRLRA